MSEDALDQLPTEPECTTCNGWGWINGSVKETCPKCGGTGVQTND